MTLLSTSLPSVKGVFQWITDNPVTTDQTPAASNLGQRYEFTTATTANRTLTLPSVGTDNDGSFLAITNNSQYYIYVEASDSDTIHWPQLNITEIELLPNSAVVVRYNHSNTKWEIAEKTGPGTVFPKGYGLYTKAEIMTLDTPAGTVARLPDEAQRHVGVARSGFALVSNPKFGGAAWFFNGTTSYVDYVDSSDWDIFGSTSGAATISFWVYCDDAVGVFEALMYQYEDANNYWGLARNASGNFQLQMVSGGSTIINISGGTLSQNTWHNVVVARVGAEIGLYIDNTQVAYLATFTPDTFNSLLTVGQTSAAASYFDGRMDDIAIVNSNIFNASPNATPDDTISVDSINPLNIVI